MRRVPNLIGQRINPCDRRRAISTARSAQHDRHSTIGTAGSAQRDRRRAISVRHEPVSTVSFWNPIRWKTIRGNSFSRVDARCDCESIRRVPNLIGQRTDPCDQPCAIRRARRRIQPCMLGGVRHNPGLSNLLSSAFDCVRYRCFDAMLRGRRIAGGSTGGAELPRRRRRVSAPARARAGDSSSPMQPCLRQPVRRSQVLGGTPGFPMATSSGCFHPSNQRPDE